MCVMGLIKMVSIDLDVMELYWAEMQNFPYRDKLLESLYFSNIETESLKELFVFDTMWKNLIFNKDV